MHRSHIKKRLAGTVMAIVLSVCLSACTGTGKSSAEQKPAEVPEPVHTQHAAVLRLKEGIENAAEKARQAWDEGVGEYPEISDQDAVRCLQELDRQNLRDAGMEKAMSADGSFMIGELGGYRLTDDQRENLQKMLSSVYAPGYTMGFVMLDLGTGRGICFNPDQKYYSASSSKASFVVSLLEKRPDLADRRRQELINITVNSDNDTYFMLEYDYGQDIHKAYAASVGVELKMDEGGFADLSAEDLARLWLANYAAFRSGELGETMGSWFETPVYSAIVPAVGEKWATRTKSGWIAGMLHNSSIDAGIVYADRHPYVLAVTSDFPSKLEDLEETAELLDRIHADMFEETE